MIEHLADGTALDVRPRSCAGHVSWDAWCLRCGMGAAIGCHSPSEAASAAESTHENCA